MNDEASIAEDRPKDLRDEFAMAALAPIILDGRVMAGEAITAVLSFPPGEYERRVARRAYAYADAMMEAREK